MPHRGIALPLPALFFGNRIDGAAALRILHRRFDHHSLLIQVPHFPFPTFSFLFFSASPPLPPSNRILLFAQVSLKSRSGLPSTHSDPLGYRPSRRSDFPQHARCCLSPLAQWFRFGPLVFISILFSFPSLS